MHAKFYQKKKLKIDGLMVLSCVISEIQRYISPKSRFLILSLLSTPR